MIPEITTERLLLRPFNVEDASMVQRQAGDRAVSELTSNVPYPYLDGMTEDWIASCDLSVGCPHGRIDGAISLLNMMQHHKAELGLWIGRPFWSKGLMTEADKANLNGCLRAAETQARSCQPL